MFFRLGLLGCFLFGLYIRIIYLDTLGFYFDTVWTQYAWAQGIQELGLFGFWREYMGYFDYLPGAVVLLWMIGGMSSIFGNDEQTFVTTLKVFNLVWDIGLVGMVVYIAERFGGFGRLGSWMIGGIAFVLPSIWFVSGVWGQMDTFLGLLMIGSVVLLYQKKFAWAGFLLACAVAVKLQAILICVPFGVYWVMTFWPFENIQEFLKRIKEGGFWRWGFGFLGGIGLFYLPAYVLNADRLWNSLLQPFLREPRISRNAGTFWTLVFDHNDASQVVWRVRDFGVTIETMATVVTLVVLLVGGIWVIRNIRSRKEGVWNLGCGLWDFASVMVFTTLTYYLFMTKVHDRYSHPALMFGLVMIASARTRVQRLISASIVVLIDTALFLVTNNAFVIDNNTDPSWPQFVLQMPFNLIHAAAVLNLVAFGLLAYVTINKSCQDTQNGIK